MLLPIKIHIKLICLKSSKRKSIRIGAARLLETCHHQFNPQDHSSQLEVKASVLIKQSYRSYLWHLRDQSAILRLEGFNNK